MRTVLDQIQQIIEAKIRLIVDGSEQCQVVTSAAFVSESEGMSTMDVAKHFSPVVVMLDEVTLGETDAKAYPYTGYAYTGDCEVTCLVENSLHFHVTESGFVQGVGRKGVRLVNLQGIGNEAVCGCK